MVSPEYVEEVNYFDVRYPNQPYKNDMIGKLELKLINQLSFGTTTTDDSSPAAL